MSEAERSGFQELARGAWLEGLALDGDQLWFSDVVAGGIRCLNCEHSGRVWRDGELWIGGILVNADGKVLHSGEGGIRWFDPAGAGEGVVVSSFEGKPIPGVNEMAPDDAGGVIFGTVDIPAFARSDAPGPVQLYHLAADGTLSLLEDGLKFTNGMAFSADRSRFFHCETFLGVFAYDWDGKQLTGRRKLLDKDDCDGMKVDVDGRIWVTGFRSSALTIIDPGGGEVDALPIPAEGATNFWFGGADGKDLYITTVKSVTVSDPAEIDIPEEPGSILIKGRSASAGLPLPRPQFRL